MSETTIAFIAKYAPPANSTAPVNSDDENKVYSRYHFDIFMILKKHFPKIITGNNAEAIINNNGKIDYIFSLLNRAPYRNSEVFISALAEYYNIPYLGARPNIRALAEDKHLAKMMATYCGITTPKWVVADMATPLQMNAPFPGPYFVKPRFGASSKHIDETSICESWEQVKNQTMRLFLTGEDAIIEEFVDGVYYSSPVILKSKAAFVLPPVQEKSILKGNVVTYLQKRKVDGGLTRTIEKNSVISKKIELASKTIMQQIQPVDYARIDFILTPTGKLHFLEFNICCNLGVQSAFVLSATSAGMSHEELILSILKESMSRQGVI